MADDTLEIIARGVGRIEAEIGALKSEVQRLQADVHGVQGSVISLRADVQSLRMETRAGFERIDKRLDQHETRIEALEPQPPYPLRRSSAHMQAGQCGMCGLLEYHVTVTAKAQALLPTAQEPAIHRAAYLQHSPGRY